MLHYLYLLPLLMNRWAHQLRVWLLRGEIDDMVDELQEIDELLGTLPAQRRALAANITQTQRQIDAEQAALAAAQAQMRAKVRA